MNTIFSTPDIHGNFENMVHRGGSFLPVNERLATVQEQIIAQWFQFTGERRQEFINLDNVAETETQEAIQRVLREITGSVADEVLRITGKTLSIDTKISAIWVEKETLPMNLLVHRDASETEIVRATFSVSPTRFLPWDVMIPIDEEEWNKRHYPMGPEILRWMESMTTTGELWSVGIMAGTTYHRWPRQEEIFSDFSKVYGDKGLKQGHIPRIFASIWGRIPK
jgi:hypothetical protein